jgi:hypothetical protein
MYSRLDFYSYRFMIVAQRRIGYGFLAFGVKVSGKSHRDTPANFCSRVMLASWPLLGDHAGAAGPPPLVLCVRWVTGVHAPLSRQSRFGAASPSGLPGQCLASASAPARRVADRKTSATTIASSAWSGRHVCTFNLSAAAVAGPTMPSTLRPRVRRWNALTAASVFGPKIPLTTRSPPCSLSRRWSSAT